MTIPTGVTTTSMGKPVGARLDDHLSGPINPSVIASAKAKKLFWFTLANYFIVNGILTFAAWLVVRAGSLPVSARTTSLSLLIKRLFTDAPGTDSWGPMLVALHTFEVGKPIYKSVFFEDHVKFQYPTSSLIPMYLMHSVGLPDAAILTGLHIASWLAFSLTILIAIRLITLVCDSFSQALGPVDRAAIAASAVLLGLICYPLTWPLLGGQVQALITAIFTLAVYLYVRGHESRAAILVGLIALVKPQFMLFLPWFFLRRQFRPLVAASATIAAGLVAAGIIFGWAEQLAYIHALSYMSKHGEVFFQNASMNGLINRFLMNGNSLEFSKNSFAPFRAEVYWGTMISSATLLGLALFYPLVRRAHRGILDFCVMAVVATVASPIAWSHHYGIVVPIFAIVAGAIVSGKIASTTEIAMASAAWVLTTNSWTPFNIWAHSPALNWLQSLPLFGMFLLLTLLCRWCVQDRLILQLVPGKQPATSI